MNNLEHNKKLVQTLVTSVFQNHDFGQLDAIMRDDYMQHNEDTPQGKAGFKGFFKDMFKAMPDFRYDPIRIISEGDIVMLYATMTATHKGEWLGNPPTGNKIKINVVDIFRIQDGKIAEHWDVADTLKLFTAVGKVK
jgi:steroid delta-isomerase-like uncharacterized protein